MSDILYRDLCRQFEGQPIWTWNVKSMFVIKAYVVGSCWREASSGISRLFDRSEVSSEDR